MLCFHKVEFTPKNRETAKDVNTERMVEELETGEVNEYVRQAEGEKSGSILRWLKKRRRGGNVSAFLAGSLRKLQFVLLS